MNIINISQSFEIVGGSDVYFHTLSELLRSEGITVDEFASSLDRNSIYPISIDFKKRDASTIIKYLYNKEASNKIERFIKEKKYDIAHLHIYYGKLTTSILQPLKNSKIPIIQTLHDYKLVCPTSLLYDGNATCFTCKGNSFYKAIPKKCNRNQLSRTFLSVLESYISLWGGSQNDIDQFITVSDFQKQQVLKMGFPKEKITTIHHFIDSNKITPSYIKGDYVLYYGRIEKIKGIDILLDAIDIIPITIKLLIVGDGEFKNEILLRLEKSQKLKESIKIIGFLKGSKLTEVISNAKFTVVPSVCFETFGLTVIEAMAYRKPVIGSNIGGITEIIDNGKDGFLVEPNNKEQLAEKIALLYANDDLVEMMGINARIKVEEKFSKKAHFDQLNSLYTKVIEQKKN